MEGFSGGIGDTELSRGGTEGGGDSCGGEGRIRLWLDLRSGGAEQGVGGKASSNLYWVGLRLVRPELGSSTLVEVRGLSRSFLRHDLLSVTAL